MIAEIIEWIKRRTGYFNESLNKYCIRHSRPEIGGWGKVRGDIWEGLEEPIDAESFRFEHEANDGPLRPGVYRIFALQDTKLRSVDEDLGWPLRVEPEEPDDVVDELPEIEPKPRTADEEIQRLANQALAEALEEGWLPGDVEEELITEAFGADSLDRSELLQRLMMERPLVGLVVAFYLDPERAGRMVGAAIGGVLEGAAGTDPPDKSDVN